MTLTRPELQLVGAQAFGFVATGGAFVALSRLLGERGFGIFATTYSTAVLLATLLHLSVGHAALARAGRPMHGPWLAAATSAARRLSLLAIPIGAIAGIVFWRLRILDDLPLAALGLAILVPLSMWDTYAGQLMSAAGRAGRLAVIISVSRSILAVTTLIGATWGTVGALGGIACGLAVSCGLAVGSLGNLPKSAVPWTAPVRAGLVLHPSALGSIVIAQGPVLVLASALGQASAGQYVLAFQLISALLVLPTAAALVLGARIATHGPVGTWARHLRLTFAVTVLVVGASGLAVLAYPLIALVLGPSNALAVDLFIAMTPALVGWSVAIMMAPQWIARGLLLQSSALTVILAAGQILLAVTFVDTWGAQGAAWATSVTFAIALLMNIGLGALAHRRTQKS